MEEDDDAQSSPLPHPLRVTAAGPAETHENGRISVTDQPVTIAAPPQHTLTLALPIQHPRPMGPAAAGGGGGAGAGAGGVGREDCWSDGASSTLIDAWGERYLELSRGNLKQKHWQDVADIVSARDDYTKTPKTDVQCKNRIDTLKKKYKMEKSKISSGRAEGSRWPFFNRLDLLIGPNLPETKPNPHHLQSPRSCHGPRAAAGKKPLAVGIRSLRRQYPQEPNRNQRSPSVSSSKSLPTSPVSSDSFPPDMANGKKRQRSRDDPPPPAAVAAIGKQKTKRGVEGLRELTRAILKFGDVYERVESSKLQQVVEMEKQRMGFAKELELQRMQFFMKTQMELTQLKHHGRVSLDNKISGNSG